MVRLGLISDPDFPEEIAQYLARVLPDQLPEQLNDDREWSVEVLRDPVAAGRRSGGEILRAAREQSLHREWDYAICVTDLPLRFDNHPVLADVGVEACVGLMSLPALGGVQPYRRARQVVIQILDEILGATEESRELPTQQRRRGLHSLLTEVLGPIRREVPNREEIGVRYRATRKRGRLRLLSGMVRSNTPWRLVFGMSGALAASLAISAFGLTSSTVWQIGDALGAWRRGVIVLGVLALMCTWLILSHKLWDKRNQTVDREQAVLYNVSTAATLGVGVSCLYLSLLVFNIIAALLLIEPELLASKLGHPVGFAHYLGLAWASATMGVAAGALGSGLENDATVRQAAYGYREAQRRRIEQEREKQREQQESGGG
ncbi:hypothetical protein FHX42_004024 [Saccharopolyspora lacisalsi]|uniref:5,10-methylene-tetrahydrofolate dehydrogenase n=1 Tax=Halosaccharopolyspora lacisalsi TaxID=1000566 RepID=A0A839E4A8_9PSEU|nr:hypothetical protein [Halosaccharopolyspora lacisalsi]MBA8826645.1 hypothetical protein [Halosaccharopolyspora lacisalsi]